MQKIPIIVRREFLTRVRKKSFIVMSILGPFLFAALIFLPILFATFEGDDMKVIAVVDSSHIFINKIPDTENLIFKYLENTNIKDLTKNFKAEGYWGVLYIAHTVAYSPNSVILYSHGQPSLGNRIHIESALKKEMERQILLAHNLEGLDVRLETAKNNLNLKTIKFEEDGQGKESNSDLAMIVGYASGFLIYFFIFLFGTQVMRGVIEEKTNRIVEVIISSVKPFELMMGKILGIAGVALLQFSIWALLTLALITVGQKAIFPDMQKTAADKAMVQDIMAKNGNSQINATNLMPAQNEGTLKANKIVADLQQINFALILFCFLFYFIGGYLLYAALFAAVGSAVDNEADTQQFVLPVTIPLILSIYVMINTINNPEGALSYWFSLIPLTSPIVMMVRLPFGVPWHEVVISMALLIVTFVAATWFAGKIYRTGILMYGKKVTYKEMFKWLKYK
jgi:ABC-2 type transport system permease protein